VDFECQDEITLYSANRATVATVRIRPIRYHEHPTQSRAEPARRGADARGPQNQSFRAARPRDHGAGRRRCRLPIKDYIRHGNEELLVILQIESPEALEQVERIVAVPGYDGPLAEGQQLFNIAGLGADCTARLERLWRKTEALPAASANTSATSPHAA